MGAFESTGLETARLADVFFNSERMVVDGGAGVIARGVVGEAMVLLGTCFAVVGEAMVEEELLGTCFAAVVEAMVEEELLSTCFASVGGAMTEVKFFASCSFWR